MWGLPPASASVDGPSPTLHTGASRSPLTVPSVRSLVWSTSGPALASVARQSPALGCQVSIPHSPEFNMYISCHVCLCNSCVLGLCKGFLCVMRCHLSYSHAGLSDFLFVHTVNRHTCHTCNLTSIVLCIIVATVNVHEWHS